MKLNEYGPTQGTPLVLLHGFPMDSRVWDGVIDRAPGRVIAADLFGFGKSIITHAFTIDAVAVELHSRLSAINALPCILAGLSMGGYLALSFAAQFPDSSAGLVLIDSKTTADDAHAKQARDQMIQLARSQGASAVADQMLPRMFGAAVDPTVKEKLRQIMLSCSPLAIENTIAAMRDRSDHTQTFRMLKCPRLILVGDEDQITPPAMAMELQKQSPGSELIVFCGAGHMAPMEQPQQIAHAIDFFRDRRISRER